MKQSIKTIALASAFAATASFAAAHEGETGSTFNYDFITPIESAIEGGKVLFDARLRYEVAGQDGRDESNALTTRLRLGYETAEYNGFTGLIEFEGTTSLLDDEDYNPYPVAGKTVIADPETAELNRIQLQWTNEENVVTAGRQAINIDNQRFVGTVDWRQNQQTFDAISITNTSFEDFKLMYAYVDQVNRIFDTDAPNGVADKFDSESHLINVQYTGFEYGVVTAYGYLLEFDNAAALSTNTYGVSFKGERYIEDYDFTLTYYAEYAEQEDNGNNTTDTDVDYYHVKLGAKLPSSLKFGVGYEVLGSDNGTVAFQTPLATGHKFNGWADVFLTTPANGLEDLYAWVGYKANIKGEDVYLKAMYHQFESDQGSTDYGDEVNLSAKYKYNERWTFIAKYANFNADSASGFTDREKFSIEANFKL